MTAARPLPEFDSPAHARAAGITDGRATPAPLLLVVDDTEDNRAVLTRRFEKRGFRVIEAENGLEALEIIERQQIDLVLLDVMMPGIDGFETLRRIRAKRSLSALPVIMVTAKTESQNVVEALEFGANDYITKPVDFAIALARVNVQIGRKQVETELAERTLSLIEVNKTLKAEIANREKSEAHSQYLAYHDSLTGLGNRLLFRKQIEQAIQSDELTDLVAAPSEFAVLFVDLDGFKSVNDSLGHSIGDLLLNAVSNRLRSLLDREDRIARLGGDEFAILQLGGAQPGASIVLAEKIIGAIGLPISIDGHDVSVSGSVGIAVGEAGSGDAESVLKNADIAMYRAKSDGRGTFRIFDPEMDAVLQARRRLEIEMRGALARQDFVLHYQPLVNLSTRKVTCFEALMRWNHPERGLISPVEFIPVAEEIGLIVPLGEWALRQACAEAMTWPGEISVSVNLSPIQFAKGNLVSTVISALASSGLPASRLELEVTESVVLERSERSGEILGQLRELGARISIDDFGTGYSGIGYLRNFQFDKIKIDQSFVRDLNEDRGSLAIVRAVIGLGVSFGLTTTAEGVETEAQVEWLRLEGCNEAQGWLFSKAIPADDVVPLLARLAAAPTAPGTAED